MRRLASVLLVAGAVGLAVAAELAVFRVNQAEEWVPDLVVGLAWLAVGVGLWSRSRAAGVLSLGVAVAWFIGGLVPGAAVWHRAVLLGLLLAAPGWLPRSRPGRVLLVIGCAAVLVPAPWGDERVNVLAAVVVVAGVAIERRSAGRLRRPMVAAAAVVAVSVTGGALVRSVVPGFAGVLPAMLAYEGALVVASGLVWLALGRYTQQVTDLVVDLGPAPAQSQPHQSGRTYQRGVIGEHRRRDPSEVGHHAAHQGPARH